jgi:hypothetical protein
MKRTNVIDLAERAAVFLRRLVDDGVATETAVRLTAAFVSSEVLGDKAKQSDPKRPWEPE